MPVDLSIMQYSEPEGFTVLLSRPYCSGAYAAGPQKLVQSFIAELMTLIGSVRFDRRYGCTFIHEIRSRNVNTINDIRSVIHSNISRVVANMQSRETGDEPAEEMIARVDLVSLIQERDGVIVNLCVVSEAGDATDLKLPLDLL
jgi:hypothetical protein